jgi:hypothetical protein
MEPDEPHIRSLLNVTNEILNMNNLIKRSALSLFFTLISLGMGADCRGQEAPQIISPAAGANLVGSFPVSLQLPDSIDIHTFRAKINGQDISELFTRESNHWRRCPISMHCFTSSPISSWEGLRNGSNLLIVSARTKDGSSQMGRVWFNWAAGLTDTPTPYIPPAVGFTIPNPGGTGPMVQIGKTQLPADNFCSTAMQVLVLDRSNLTQSDYQCFNDSASLNTYLKTLNSGQLVIAGTVGSQHAPSALDTTPIGGTNYTKVSANLYPQGYFIIGVGATPSNQVYENYWVPESDQAPFGYAPFLNGLLVKDETGHYNFHPSDNPLFIVSPDDADHNNSSVVTIGNQVYTSPKQTEAGGFWVLIVDRMLLQPVDSNWNGGSTCVYGAALNTGTCGAFFPTGASDSATAQKAMSDLTAALTNVPSRNLVFLTSVGHPMSLTPTAELGKAVAALGGSDYLLTRLGTTYNYVLIGSTDSGFSQALTGKAVLSSNYYTQQKQTGYVRGLLTRGLDSLLAPGPYSQESAAQNAAGNGFNYEFQQVAFAQPVDWPLTDTTGHVNAYQALSKALTNAYFQGAIGHLDDIRFYYLGSQAATLLQKAAGQDPKTFSYPGDGQGFSSQDWTDARNQISTEINYLRQADSFLGVNGVQGAIAGNNTSLTLSIMQAAATVKANTPAVNNQTTVSLSAAQIIKAAISFVKLGAEVGVGASSDDNTSGTGILTEAFQTALSMGSSLYKQAKTIPSGQSTAVVTLNDLSNVAGEAQTYTSAVLASYGTVLDNIYSDWYKLSTVGARAVDTSGSWYWPDHTYSSAMASTINNGAQRNLYLQLLPQSYKRDVWNNQPANDPTKIGSWYQTSCGGIQCYFQCRSVYSPYLSQHQDPWTVFPTLGSSTAQDVVVLAGPVQNNGTTRLKESYPSDTLLTILWGSDGLNLPKELLFSANSPFGTQVVPMYDIKMGSCYNIGGTKHVP